MPRITLKQSKHHFRAVDAIFGSHIAHCMGDMSVAKVLHHIKKEKNGSTMIAKGNAMMSAVHDDNENMYIILRHLNVPENETISLDGYTNYCFPYVWQAAMHYNASKIFSRAIRFLKKYDQERKDFASSKTIGTGKSPLFCAIQRCITLRGAAREQSYVNQIMGVKFTDEECDQLMEADDTGFNPYDRVVSESTPSKYSGPIRAYPNDWVLDCLETLIQFYCPQAIKDRTTPDFCDLPNATALCMAVVRGNFSIVERLAEEGFSNGVADKDSSQVNSLYAPALAIVYALHTKSTHVDDLNERLKIALHLLSLPTTNVNQRSGTGRQNNTQFLLPELIKLSAYEHITPINLCFITSPSHKQNLMPILKTILGRQGTDLYTPHIIGPTRNPKTILELAVESRNYDALLKLLQHMKSKCKNAGDTSRFQAFIEQKYAHDTLSLMQALCVHADCMQSRIWGLTARRRSRCPKFQGNMSTTLSKIFDCIKFLMPLSPSHRQSTTWFAISYQRSEQSKFLRNANWANMMFEFWKPSMHQTKAKARQLSTEGVGRISTETITVLLMCLSRINGKKTKCPLSMSHDGFLHILSMLSRLDLVPLERRESIWPIVIQNKTERVVRSASDLGAALHLSSIINNIE